jgi:hypothetical protein
VVAGGVQVPAAGCGQAGDVPANAYVGPDGPGSIKGYPVVRWPGKSGLDAEVASHLWEATAALTGAGAALGATPST